MDLTRYFSIRQSDLRRQTSLDLGGHEDHVKRSLPILASPINEHVREAFSRHSSDLEKATTSRSRTDISATTSFAGNGRMSSGNLVIYKQHHEASTIELFYDLYFVANLGTRRFFYL